MLSWFGRKVAAPVEPTEDDTYLALCRTPYDQTSKAIGSLHNIVTYLAESHIGVFRENEAELKKHRILRFLGYQAILRRPLLKGVDKPIERQLRDGLGKYGWTLEDYQAETERRTLEQIPEINAYDLGFWTIVIAVATTTIGCVGLMYTLAGWTGAAMFLIAMSCYPILFLVRDVPRNHSSRY